MGTRNMKSWSAVAHLVLLVLMAEFAFADLQSEGSGEADGQWLQALYESTNGDGWGWSQGWNMTPGANPCALPGVFNEGNSTWNGVTCTAPYGRVNEIFIVGNNLVGTLPEVTGGSLSQVVLLNLQRNRLSGTVSLGESFARKTLSVNLVLNDNQFTGTIPSFYCALGALDVSDNFLTGTLPECSSSDVLQSIHARNNSLTGTLPASWGYMAGLTDIWTGENLLTGTLPGTWGSLSSLSGLDLSRNQLTGTLPPAWGSLSSLWTLDLSSNQLTGTLPPAWGSLSSLQNLILSNNQLSGTLPPSWSGLTSLSTWFELGNNRLSGTLPDSWSNLTNLYDMNLSNNLLSGTLPLSWAKLGRDMSSMTLTNNSLSGPFPSTWVGAFVDLTPSYGPYFNLANNCLNVSSIPPVDVPWWKNASGATYTEQRTDCQV